MLGHFLLFFGGAAAGVRGACISTALAEGGCAVRAAPRAGSLSSSGKFVERCGSPQLATEPAQRRAILRR